jgi:hypothetical protein
MARAWKVTGLKPRMSLRSVGRRVLAVRIAEFYSFAPFIHDPQRVTELHDMRIAAKRLRYTLELFRVCYPPSVEAAIEQVKEIQELLGQIHDADVLREVIIERVAAITRAQEEALVDRLDAEVDDEVRLATIRGHLGTRERDPRLGLYALFGRTVHRRRRWYADFLDLWARLETRGFRHDLEALTVRPGVAGGPPVDVDTLESVVASG